MLRGFIYVSDALCFRLKGESGFDFLAARLGPQGVERARLVHALVGVGAEVVALALDEGGRQTLGTQGRRSRTATRRTPGSADR